MKPEFEAMALEDIEVGYQLNMYNFVYDAEEVMGG